MRKEGRNLGRIECLVGKSIENEWKKTGTFAKMNYVNPSIPKEKNGAEVFTKWVQTLERFRGGKDRKTH